MVSKVMLISWNDEIFVKWGGAPRTSQTEPHPFWDFSNILYSFPYALSFVALLFQLPQTLFSLIHVHHSENLISIFLTHLCIKPLCAVWYLRNLSLGPIIGHPGATESTECAPGPSMEVYISNKQNTHKTLGGGIRRLGRRNRTASQQKVSSEPIASAS